MIRRAGRTKSSELTIDETGFPGGRRPECPTPPTVQRQRAWPAGWPPASTASCRQSSEHVPKSRSHQRSPRRTQPWRHIGSRRSTPRSRPRHYHGRCHGRCPPSPGAGPEAGREGPLASRMRAGGCAPSRQRARPRSKDPDPWPSIGHDLGEPYWPGLPGGLGSARCPQTTGGTRPHISPGKTDELAGHDRFQDGDGARVGVLGALHHADGVGSLRKRGSRHDPHGLPGSHGALERWPAATEPITWSRTGASAVSAARRA